MSHLLGDISLCPHTLVVLRIFQSRAHIDPSCCHQVAAAAAAAASGPTHSLIKSTRTLRIFLYTS